MGLILNNSQPDNFIGSMGFMLELIRGWTIISWIIIGPFVYCQSKNTKKANNGKQNKWKIEDNE
jgi:hypothetical protein